LRTRHISEVEILVLLDAPLVDGGCAIVVGVSYEVSIVVLVFGLLFVVIREADVFHIVRVVLKFDDVLDCQGLLSVLFEKLERFKWFFCVPVESIYLIE